MNKEDVITYLSDNGWRRTALDVYSKGTGEFNRPTRLRLGKMYVMLDLHINGDWINISRQHYSHLVIPVRGPHKGHLLVGTNQL